MLASMIVYLEDERRTDLSAILQVSRFVFLPQWEFSRVVSNQRKLYASLRVPIRCRKSIEENLDFLSKIACQIYIDDEEYYFLGFNDVGMLPIQTEELEFENRHIILDSVDMSQARILAHSAMQRIWMAATKEAVAFA